MKPLDKARIAWAIAELRGAAIEAGDMRVPRARIVERVGRVIGTLQLVADARRKAAPVRKPGPRS